MKNRHFCYLLLARNSCHRCKFINNNRVYNYSLYTATYFTSYLLSNNTSEITCMFVVLMLFNILNHLIIHLKYPGFDWFNYPSASDNNGKLSKINIVLGQNILYNISSKILLAYYIGEWRQFFVGMS